MDFPTERVIFFTFGAVLCWYTSRVLFHHYRTDPFESWDPDGYNKAGAAEGAAALFVLLLLAHLAGWWFGI